MFYKWYQLLYYSESNSKIQNIKLSSKPHTSNHQTPEWFQSPLAHAPLFKFKHSCKIKNYSILHFLTGPFVAVALKQFGTRATVFCAGIVLTAGFVGASFATSISELILTHGVIAGQVLFFRYVNLKDVEELFVQGSHIDKYIIEQRLKCVYLRRIFHKWKWIWIVNYCSQWLQNDLDVIMMWIMFSLIWNEKFRK